MIQHTLLKFVMNANFLCAVVAYRFDRTGGKGFLTQEAFLVVGGLLVNKRVAVVIRAREVVGRGVAAHVAINALRVNIVSAHDAFGHTVIRVSQFLFPPLVACLMGKTNAARARMTSDRKTQARLSISLNRTASSVILILLKKT